MQRNKLVDVSLNMPVFYPQVFGALASEPFKVSDGFYGTGETFVFTFCPEFEVRKVISASQVYKKEML